MDPKFRSSFIPKKPLSPKTDGGGVRRRRTSFNLMTFIASIVFVIAVAASGGVYAYAYILQDKIDQKGIELKTSLDRINLGQIDEYKLLDERLDAAWQLLLNHKITYKIFGLLEDNTLHNVQFDQYQYNVSTSDSKNDVVVTLDGQAKSYEALVVQSDVLKQNEFVSRIDVNNIRREEKEDILPNTGNIIFTLKLYIDRKLVEYDLQLNQDTE